MKKLKVLISTIVISTLMISMAGCGSSKTKDPAKDNAQTTGNTQTQQNTGDKDTKGSDKKATYKKDSDLPKTLKAELTTQSYWIDAPWRLVRVGTGWYSMNENLCIIYDQFLEGASETDFKIDPSTIKTPDQIIDGMKAQFLSTATGELPVSDYDYEIKKKENVKVNDWDMCRYEGIFILKNTSIKDNKASFVAYSVIKENHPVYFVVIDKSYEQTHGQELGPLADKIAKTFRDKGVE